MGGSSASCTSCSVKGAVTVALSSPSAGCCSGVASFTSAGASCSKYACRCCKNLRRLGSSGDSAKLVLAPLVDPNKPFETSLSPRVRLANRSRFLRLSCGASPRASSASASTSLLLAMATTTLHAAAHVCASPSVSSSRKARRYKFSSPAPSLCGGGCCGLGASSSLTLGKLAPLALAAAGGPDVADAGSGGNSRQMATWLTRLAAVKVPKKRARRCKHVSGLSPSPGSGA
mmetsp:Transcript_6952/g.25606  ORF Transcript_6952/g.25606 Transcript_6952/m.25606 type:complete len:231 (-) Transcript_6952:1220-1912(-)